MHKPVTTFPEERHILKHGNEHLVSALVGGKSTLIASDGFRTDYPVLSDRDGVVFVEWDSPHHWSPAFQQEVRRYMITQLA